MYWKKLSIGTLLACSVGLNLYFFFRPEAPAAPVAAPVVPVAPVAPPRVAAAVAPGQMAPIRFRELSVHSYDRDVVRLRFDLEGELAEPKPGMVTVTPDLPFDVSTYNGALAIRGSFKPTTRYTFRVGKGLAGTRGQTLEEAIEVSYTTPDEDPAAEFLSGGLTLPLRRKEFVLPVEAVNCDRIDVTLHKAFENNLNGFSFYDGRFSNSMLKVASYVWNLPKAPQNRRINAMLELDKLLPERTPGFYRVELDGKGFSRTSYFNLTDLALQAAVNEPGREARVFVRRFSDGSAAKGAAVTLWSDKNQCIASGVADADGMARLTFDPAWNGKQDTPRSVIAKLDGDLAFFPLNVRHDTASAPEFDWNAPRVFLFAERGVCRPGEAFDLSLFARAFDADGKQRPMADAPLKITVRDPLGKQFATLSVRTDASGFAAVPVELPLSAAAGRYRISCGPSPDDAWGSTVMEVASYVPDRIKVALDAAPDRDSVDSVQEYTLRANYYFGPVLESGSWQFAVFAKPGFRPAHWPKEWTVGDETDFVAPDEFRERGELPLTKPVHYPGFAARGGKAFEPVELIASATATEPGGRGVSAFRAAIVHPSDLYLGVRQEGGGAVALRLLTARPDDKEALAKTLPVAFSLARLEWEYVLTRAEGSYRRQWRQARRELPVAVAPITLGGDRIAAEIALPADLPEGSYELLASSGAAIRTRMNFWHMRGEGGRRSGNPSELTFRTDAERYLPGSVAKVTVAVPFAGDAFVVSGLSRFDRAAAYPVKPGEHTFEIPIPAGVEQSSYFAAFTLVEQGGKLNRSFGVLEFAVDQEKAHRLTLAIDAPPVARPGETITIRTALSGADGAPRGGTVRLFAVDEGVLALTAYRTPDIFAHFFGRAAAPFAFYDVYGNLRPELRILPDGTIGGDKAISAKMSEKLGDAVKSKPCVRLILPPAKIAADGKGEFTVVVPDHLGALRLMAVAAAPDAVGSAERALTVRDAIGATVSAPRFLAAGDTAECRAVLFNHDRDEADYTFTVTLPQNCRAESPLTLRGKLGRGKSIPVAFRIAAASEAPASEIKWTLKLGNVEKSGVEFISVRPIFVSQSASDLNVLAAGETRSFALPESEWRPGAKATLSIGAPFSAGVAESLEWLNEYPYGCLEQTVAGAFPFLALEMLEKSGALTPAAVAAVRHKAATGYRRILPMQLQSGAFATWPGGFEEWTDGSLFAAHFIAEGIARGKIADDPVVTRPLRNFLRNLAQNAAPENRRRRAYAAYTLALFRDAAGANAARAILAGSRDDFAALLGALALVKGGYAAEGAAHLPALLERKLWSESGIPAGYCGDAGRLGMMLYLLADNNVGDDKLLASLANRLQSLLRKDGSGWGSTQNNAWATLGLAACAAMQPAVAPECRVRFADGSEERVTAFPANFALRTPVEVVNSGKTPLAVTRTVRGVPVRPVRQDHALILSKRYCDADGNILTQVRHGDLVYIKLAIRSDVAVDDLVVADLLPAGLEIEDERLATRAVPLPSKQRRNYGSLTPSQLERRDDRMLVFGQLRAGESEFTYRARAVIRGRFAIPPLQAESMYRPELSGASASGASLEIR